jgi:phage-related protein
MLFRMGQLDVIQQYIHSISLKNFKTFGDEVTVSLENPTVII